MSRVRHRKIFIVLLALAALAIIPGCSFLEKIRPSATKNTFGGLTGSSVEHQLFVKKFNAFIECVNNVDRSVQNSYEDYVRQVKSQPALSGGNPRNASSSWSGPSFSYINATDQKRVKDLEKALDDSPQIEGLDGAGREYVGAFNKLTPLIDEARTYYQQRNFKDDNFAKGRQMNTGLMEAYNGFIKASQHMGDEVDKQEDALRQREMTELEKKGTHETAYFVVNLYVQSKKLFKASQQHDVKSEQFAPAFEAYSKTYQEAKEYVEKHPDKENGSPVLQSGKLAGVVSKAPFMMPNMDGAGGDSPAERLLIQGKEMSRHLKNNQRPPKTGLGSAPSMAQSYEELINSLNTVSMRQN